MTHTTIVATSRARHTRRMKSPIRTSRPLFAYVGSYTTPERHGQGNGINVYRVDRRTGAFRHVQHLGGLENPSFLAINAAGTRLYSVHGDRSEVNSFTIDPRHRPSRRRSIASRPAATIRSISPSTRPAASSPSATTAPICSPSCRSRTTAACCPTATLTTVTGHPGAASHPAAHHVRAPHPARPPGPLLLRAVQGLRRRDRLSPRHQARRAGRGRARGRPARRRAAPYRFPSAQGAGLCHQRARIRRSRPIGRTAEAARSRRCRRSPPRRRTSPATAPAPRSGSIAPAATSTSPIAATTASACSRIDPAKGTLAPRQWVPTHGGTPRFFAFDPAQRFLYVANQDGRRSSATASAATGCWRRRASGSRSAARRASSSRIDDGVFR